jgi:hypothetical protein
MSATTTLTARPIRRETPALWRGRPLIIVVFPYDVTIHPKGLRTAYHVTYEQIFRLGAENEVKRIREERAAKRKANRAALPYAAPLHTKGDKRKR